MTWAWNGLFVFNTKKLRPSLSLWVECMISLVVRIYFSDFWANCIKARLFGFLFIYFILKSFDSGAKELERKRFFFDLQRTFIYIILSRRWVFALKVIHVSFSGCLVQVCFVIQWLKKSPYCGRFKITGWRISFFAHSQLIQIQLILPRTHVRCMVQRKSSRLILSPDCTCKVEFALFVWIVVARA